MKVGVIGLGLAGARLHLPALLGMDGVTIVAVSDPDPRTHARASGIAAFTNAGSVIERADAVVIASPPATHAEVVRQAIDAGVHVYCEKPMTTSIHDAVEIAHAAKSITLQVGYAYRFHPLWQRAITLARRGTLRPPFQIRGHFPSRNTGEGWMHPVVDTGTHHLDLISVLTGSPPTNIRATPEASLTARWSDGSTLEGEYAPNAATDVVTIRSNQMTLTIDRTRGTRLRARGGKLGSLGLPVPSLVRARLSRSGWERSFRFALQAFIACAHTGEPAVPGPRDGVAGVAACEAMLRSITSGRDEAVEASW